MNIQKQIEKALGLLDDSQGILRHQISRIQRDMNVKQKRLVSSIEKQMDCEMILEDLVKELDGAGNFPPSVPDPEPPAVDPPDGEELFPPPTDVPSDILHMLPDSLEGVAPQAVTSRVVYTGSSVRGEKNNLLRVHLYDAPVDLRAISVFACIFMGDLVPIPDAALSHAKPLLIHINMNGDFTKGLLVHSILKPKGVNSFITTTIGPYGRWGASDISERKKKVNSVWHQDWWDAGRWAIVSMNLNLEEDKINLWLYAREGKTDPPRLLTVQKASEFGFGNSVKVESLSVGNEFMHPDNDTGIDQLSLESAVGNWLGPVRVFTWAAR